MRMKDFYLIVIFLAGAFPFQAAGQAALYGKVATPEGSGIPNAAIYLPSLNAGTYTDEKGDYFLEFEPGQGAPKALMVRASCVGYLAVEVEVEWGGDVQRKDFQLTPSPEELPEVVVKARENLLEREWLYLHDFELMGDQIILLFREKGGAKLIAAGLDGEYWWEMAVEYPYSALYKSCLGGLHLIGEQWCQEFVPDRREGFLKGRNPREAYEQKLFPCLLLSGKGAVLEIYSNSNQKKTFIQAGAGGKHSREIYIIYDEKGEQSAQATLRDIIRGYYRHINNPPEDAVDAGFVQHNIIEYGEWDGDVDKLSVNRELDQLANYYKHIELRPVEGWARIKEDGLWILDPLNRRLVKADEEGQAHYNLPLWIGQAAGFLQDEATGELYMLSGQNGRETLVHIGTDPRSPNFTVARPEGEPLWYVSKRRIRAGLLYELGQRSPVGPERALSVRVIRH